MPRGEQKQLRVAVDIGGTFTDIVLMTESGVYTQKVHTTPHDHSEAVIAGLKQVLKQHRLDPKAVSEIVHGTTVGTNAIIERKGAKTGLVTTKGFKDVLELGRLRRPFLYDLMWEKPESLVERYLRQEVPERVNAKGEVLVSLDHLEVRETLRRLVEYEIEALAVCLLHSYTNTAHEEQIRQLAQEVCPELYLSISSEVLPEMKEFERASTTVVNAYVGPLVQRYLTELLREISNMGITAPFSIMQSNGAIMRSETAMKFPVRLLESGPAAGVVGAAYLAKKRQDANVITLDLGGTTAKASLIEKERLTYIYQYEVGGPMAAQNKLLSGAGYAVGLPALDIVEVGTGGGSIAWLDTVGQPHVGPRSSGAVPGPVCYDMGGAEATLTDCDVVLGYLNPDYLLGGSVPINAAKSHEAVDQTLANQLGLSTFETAHGVYLLAVSNMARAVKSVTTERGRDPRDFIVYAFGGAGPLCAAELARGLGISRVVIPAYPGLFSAFGMLFTDMEAHHVQSHFCLSSDLSVETLQKLIDKLRDDAMNILGRGAFSEDQVQFIYSVDARYRGQNSELSIPLAGSVADEQVVAAIERDFSEEHQRTYGFRVDTGQIEIVNIRVVARVLRSYAPAWDYVPTGRDGMPANNAQETGASSRMAFFGPDYGLMKTPILTRYKLSSRPRKGPIIVEEYDSTIVVPPGCSAILGDFGNVEIQIEH